MGQARGLAPTGDRTYMGNHNYQGNHNSVITRETEGNHRGLPIQNRQMAFNPKFTITPKINKGLVEIERVIGFLEAIRLKDKRNLLCSYI